MEVEIISEHVGVTFSSLDIGDLFVHKGKTYVKTCSNRNGEVYRGVVVGCGGSGDDFNDNPRVVPVVKVTVET